MSSVKRGEVGTIEYNEYFRRYREANRKKWRDYRREYNKKWRKENGYHNEANSKRRYPEKERARRKLRYAVKTGKIKRGACDVCGRKNGQAHHEDYNKPLEVRWLCALHHRQVENR